MMLNFCFHRVNDDKDDIYSLSELKIIKLLNIFKYFPFQYRISFDDGYLDSYEFIKKYSKLYKNVEWIFFICPLKCENSEGVDGLVKPKLMANIAQLKELESFENVRIGNHTNNHLRQSELSDEELKNEYTQSLVSFKKHFSDDIGLAFPYGTPEVDFDQRGVEFCRNQGLVMWSTEALADKLKEGIHQRVVIRDESIFKIVLKVIYYLYVKPIVSK